jgi:hypothetical protein
MIPNRLPLGFLVPFCLLLLTYENLFGYSGMHKKSIEAAAHLEQVGDQDDDDDEEEEEEDEEEEKGQIGKMAMKREPRKGGRGEEYSEDEKDHPQKGVGGGGRGRGNAMTMAMGNGNATSRIHQHQPQQPMMTTAATEVQGSDNKYPHSYLGMMMI